MAQSLQQLLGKKVRFVIILWEERGPEPRGFEGMVTGVDGTLIFVSDCKSITGGRASDAWHNTACLHFKSIQQL